MKIKNLKLGILMAVTILMIGTPIVKSSAQRANNSTTTTEETNNSTTTTTKETNNSSETTTIEQSEYIKKYDEYINEQKEKFHKAYGTEDEFEEIYQSEYMKEEINGATGDIKITNPTTGQVYQEYNYFNQLEEEKKIAQMTEDEYEKYLREDFQKQYGTENTFKVTNEDEYQKEEVNGATGDIKITDKETGKVEISNYYEDIDERLQEYKIIDDKEYDEYLKNKFQEKYGKEDKFQTIYEDSYQKAEINGGTGEIKITNKETNRVYSENFFIENESN